MSISPPRGPLALIRPLLVTSSATMVILPFLLSALVVAVDASAFPKVLASILPVLFTLSADKRITPPSRRAPRASMVPVLLITARCRLLAARALMNTLPSSALTSCLFSTRAFKLPLLMMTLIPLAELVSVISSPAARITVPSLARMMPSLRTSGASKAMRPASLAVSSPWLVTMPLPSVNR